MASSAQDGALILVAPAADAATLVTTKSGVGGEMVGTSSGAIREWPELVGLPGATAVGKIQAEQPQLSEVERSQSVTAISFTRSPSLSLCGS